jgi:hypothetical protein
MAKNKGNILVVSYRANTIRGNATVAEMRKVASFYEDLLKGESK